MPAAAIGTFDDAVEHVQLLSEAGVSRVALFPALDIAQCRNDLRSIGELARVMRA